MQKNLPLSPSIFVERQREIAQIERALADPDINIVTIHGVGGSGKTVLARFVVERLRQSNQFSGGIFWIDCRIEDSLLKMLTTIAHTIGEQPASFTPSNLREVVLSHLRSKPTLLIFDTYEAVANDDEILSFIGRLPKQAKALIVSRQRVRVHGREITLHLESLTEAETLELLRQNLSSKRWSEIDTNALREIHRWTGGLPLAVGLVASLLEQGRSLPGILGQLREGAIPAERVVERVLDQVDTTLTEEQHRLLDALSVFAYPVDRAAVTAVAKIDHWQIIAERLAQRAVIEIVDGRYTLHPLVRTYFRNRIPPRRLETFQRKMVEYYLGYINKFQYDFDQIEQEWLNVQYAGETAYRNQLRQEFIAFVLRLGEFTTARGYENEYRKWLNQAIEVSDEIGDVSARAALLHNLGVQYQQRGDLDAAVKAYEQSLALKEATGNAAAESATLTNLGAVHRSLGDIKSAIAYYERALTISRQIGDRLGEANIVGSLGVSYADWGEYRRAVAYYEQSLAISKEIGDRQGEATALYNLATVYKDRLGGDRGENREQAIAYYHRALEISREIGDRRIEANLYANLGTAYSDRLGGDRGENREQAIAYYHRALEISREIGNRLLEAVLYGNLGTTYSDRLRGDREENLEQAIAYYHRALEISREIGDQLIEANLYGNLGTAYSSRLRGDRGENLQQAIAYYDHALEIIQRNSYPLEYATVQNNLASAYASLSMGDRAENIERAIAHYHNALQIRTRGSSPLEWAATLNNLANVYLNRQAGNQAENIEQAISLYQEALQVYTPVSSPLDWAATQSNLAVAFSQRVHGDHAENLRQAITGYEQALRVFTKEAQPNDWLRATTNLSTSYAELGDWPKARASATTILQSFLQSTTLDLDSLNALLPWYQRLGELALQSRDMEFATRVFAEAAFRFELQGEKVPSAIRNRLVELREQLGNDRFGIIWAEAQRILTPVLAQTLHEARELMSQERYNEAADKLSNALTLILEADTAKELKRQTATILFLRGFCLRKQELWEEALQDQEQAFQLFEELRDFSGEAQTFLEMGYLFEVMNNYEDARLHYMDAYRLYRRAEDKHGMAVASENLGRLEYRVRMFSQAVQDLEEARKLYISVGDRIKAMTIESDLETAKASLAYQAAREKERGENE